MTRRWPILALALGALTLPAGASAEALTRAPSPGLAEANLGQIYFNSASLSPRCLDFKISGVCVKYKFPASVKLGV